MSDDTKRKISEAKRGRKLSEEAKISRRKKYDQIGSHSSFFGIHRSGEQNPFFGKKHSPEAIAKMKAAAKLRKKIGAAK